MNGTSGFGEMRSSTSRSSINRFLDEQGYRSGTLCGLSGSSGLSSCSDATKYTRQTRQRSSYAGGLFLLHPATESLRDTDRRKIAVRKPTAGLVEYATRNGHE